MASILIYIHDQNRDFSPKGVALEATAASFLSPARLMGEYRGPDQCNSWHQSKFSIMLQNKIQKRGL